MNRGTLCVAACLLALLAACATKKATPALSADQKAVDATVRADVRAENSKDVKTFAALWTDKGLKAYDQGTRTDILAGKSSIGETHVTIVEIHPAEVHEATARVIVDGSMDNPVAAPEFRVSFGLIKDASGAWLFDDFNFVGSPPPAKDDHVVPIRAVEYRYEVPASIPSKVAFTFTNGGKEQHEITLFRASSNVGVAEAAKALENVNGHDLDNVPAGYQVNHIAFAQPGESVSITLAKPLASGTYVLACYIPQGGVGDNGPVNPAGKPHIKLGMISVVQVG